MTEDSFHATVKLVTGEEILTEIIECEENGQDFFLFHNPIIITENNHVDMQKGIVVSGSERAWSALLLLRCCILPR